MVKSAHPIRGARFALYKSASQLGEAPLRGYKSAPARAGALLSQFYNLASQIVKQDLLKRFHINRFQNINICFQNKLNIL
jgi:hypothetical protein